MAENPGLCGDAIVIVPNLSADVFSACVLNEPGEVHKCYLFDAVGERVNV